MPSLPCWIHSKMTSILPCPTDVVFCVCSHSCWKCDGGKKVSSCPGLLDKLANVPSVHHCLCTSVLFSFLFLTDRQTARQTDRQVTFPPCKILPIILPWYWPQNCTAQENAHDTAMRLLTLPWYWTGYWHDTKHDTDHDTEMKLTMILPWYWNETDHDTVMVLKWNWPWHWQWYWPWYWPWYRP